jgi:hypothetical protein
VQTFSMTWTVPAGGSQAQGICIQNTGSGNTLGTITQGTVTGLTSGTVILTPTTYTALSPSTATSSPISLTLSASPNAAGSATFATTVA